MQRAVAARRLRAHRLRRPRATLGRRQILRRPLRRAREPCSIRLRDCRSPRHRPRDRRTPARPRSSRSSTAMVFRRGRTSSISADSAFMIARAVTSRGTRSPHPTPPRAWSPTTKHASVRQGSPRAVRVEPGGCLPASRRRAARSTCCRRQSPDHFRAASESRAPKRAACSCFRAGSEPRRLFSAWYLRSDRSRCPGCARRFHRRKLRSRTRGRRSAVCR